MDDTPFSQPRSESPRCDVVAADASTRTADEDFILVIPIRYASTQTAGDFDLHTQIQSGSNISVVTLESAVDTSEAVFSGFHDYRNNCDVVETEVQDVSSSMGASIDLDMAVGSENHAEFYMQQAFPENVPSYSRQSTLHENNKTASIQGKSTVDFSAVHTECRTINNNVCGISEAPRNENVDNFLSSGTEPRNVAAESCMPQAFPENIAHYSRQPIQHESNKCTFIQGTHTVDFPAVPHQSNHSSHQHTEKHGSRNASAEGTQLLKSSVLSSSKKFFTCEKCKFRCTKEFAFNTHVLGNCDPNPFKCDECGMVYPSQGLLSKHYRIHGEKSFKCSKCDYATYQESNLKMHFNRIHEK